MSTVPKAWRNVPPPNGSDAKATMYARFIPREELSSFEAWKLGDLGSSTPDAAALAAAAAAASAAQAARTPKRDPAELVAEQLHAARQSGYQDGYRDGLVALEGFKQSFAHQTTLQVGALVQSVGSQLDALQQEMAQSIATTALHLARQIVRSELAARPDAVVKVAQEAIDTLLLSARHITLRVHPDDQPLVAAGTGDVLAARGARIVGDASMSRGGCLVESDIGLIDATVETRWRRAAATLGGDEAWASADVPPGAPEPAA